MKTFDTAYGRMAYDIFGNSGATLVFEAGLCSCGAEWRHIARKFGSRCRALIYDRAGYGGSPADGRERTSGNVASGLDALLGSLGMDKNILLLGHSQGGLYAVQYALMHPEKVRGLLLLDPATPFDSEFRAKLTSREYLSSGVDKTAGFRLALALTSLGLGPVCKPLLLKSPPFHYHDFEPEEQNTLLANLTKRQTYRTALAEYRCSHLNDYTRGIAKATESGGLGGVPIRLITHSSDFYIRELQDYAGLEERTARKVESIWQEIMLRYLGLSSDSRHATAPHSGHYIHLTDPLVVEDSILELL